MMGQPMWAMKCRYDCCGEGGCGGQFFSHKGKLLSSLPDYIANCYPVKPSYAQGKSHLDCVTTNIIEDDIVTYANGDHATTIIFKAISDDYNKRAASYFSFCLYRL